MNEFEPKKLKEASHYLQDKLDLFKKGGAKPSENNAYILENKKNTMFKRFVNSIFQK
jgi:hypothetical protein